MTTTKRIAVAGASGYLGGYVVRALHDAGWSVRALSRSKAKLERRLEPDGPQVLDLCDEVVVAEATRAETLAGFCDGCDAAYVGLGIRSASRRPTFWDVDRDANMNVLREAERAGVDHVVFIAAIHADELARRGVGPAVAREAVVDAIKGGDRRYTIVRGTGFFNDMGEFFEMARKGRGWLVGDGSLTINPVHGADLADEVVRALSDEACWNREIVRGGPEVLTLREILELGFDVLGKPPKLSRVPAWLLTPARYVVWPFNGTLAGFLHAIRELARMGDATAPACGTHRLRDYYEELAAEE